MIVYYRTKEGAEVGMDAIYFRLDTEKLRIDGHDGSWQEVARDILANVTIQDNNNKFVLL